MSGVKNLKLVAVRPTASAPRRTIRYRATASAKSASTMYAPWIACNDAVSKGKGL